jgi:hypothetical protein
VLSGELLYLRARLCLQVNDNGLPPERLAPRDHAPRVRRRQDRKASALRVYLLDGFADDVQQQEVRPIFGGQTGGSLQCLRGVIRIVHRDQNLLNIHAHASFSLSLEP